MTTLPHNIQNYLAGYARRRRGVAVVRAVGLAAVFLVCWMLLWCLTDRMVPLAGWVRAVVLGLGLAGVALLVRRPVGGMLGRRVDWVAVAREVERREPAFGERLETVTSRLLGRVEHRGSDAMLGRLVGEVSEQVGRGEPERLEPWAPAVRPWVVVGGLVVLVAALWPFEWLDLPRLMLRFVAPTAGVSPVTTTRITAAHEPTRVMQGDGVTITATAMNLGDGGLTLRTSVDGQTWTVRPMTRAGDAFGVALPAAERDFSYFVSGGDGRTDTTRVEVLRRPTVREYRVRYEYPPYMAREPLTLTNTDGAIEAPAATVATVSVVSGEPLADATFVVDGKPIPTTPTVERTVRQARLTIERDAQYEVRLTSTQGADGSGGGGRTIRAIADQRPIVRLLEPGDDLRLTPRDVLAVRYQAMDDYGLRSVRVVAHVNGVERQSADLRLRGDPRRQEAVFDLDMATLSPELGDAVRLTLEATDAAGQTATTPPREVLVTPRSIDMNTYLRLAELSAAARMADAMAQAVEAAKEARREAAKAAKSDDDSGRYEWLARAEYDHRLAAAGETAALLRQALVRAIVRTDPRDGRETADAIATLVDAAQQVASGMEHLAGREVEADDAAATLDAAGERARQLKRDAKTLADGQRAAALATDRVNVAAMERRAGQSGDEAVKRTAKRARDELNEAVRQVGVNPDAGDADRQLEAKAEAARQWARGQRPVDFVEAARAWTKGDAAAGRAPVALVALVPRLNAAAQAEAVRPAGDLVRARDLQLAAAAAEGLRRRAPAAIGPGVAWEGEQYPAALEAVVREHDLHRRSQDVMPPDELKRIVDAAAVARGRLSEWADVDASTARGPAEAARREQRAALEAAARTAMREYEAAHAADDRAAAQRRAATDDAAATAVPPDEPTVVRIGLGRVDDSALGTLGAVMGPMAEETGRSLVREATETARALDEIAAEQATLATETGAVRGGDGDASPDADDAETSADAAARAAALGERQGRVVDAIDAVRKRVEDPLDVVADERQRDARGDAMAAVTAAQARLAAMPGELAETQRRAARDRSAREAARAAETGLAGAAAERREQAERLVAAARASADEARRAVEAAAVSVAPAVAEGIADALRKHDPVTTGATAAVDTRLTPALRSLKQGIDTADAGGTERGVTDARAAVGDVQEQLRLAQAQLAQRDPLVAAKWYARQAQAALAMRPPDYELAGQSQAAASAALARAWQDAVHRAARYRLSGTSGMVALYEGELATMGAGGSTSLVDDGAGTTAAPRAWGRVRVRDPGDVTAAERETDPPGYQEALRAYFEALGRQDGAGERK